ncbi:hypothetical protein WJX73_006684 [Symbiochloris irregularis]|uniref:Uncharacterized protein n=1 Tax=Symbiochloris irregularis TaxID=706552 RepID=A0AAW1NSD4_9CHLO
MPERKRVKGSGSDRAAGVLHNPSQRAKLRSNPSSQSQAEPASISKRKQWLAAAPVRAGVKRPRHALNGQSRPSSQLTQSHRPSSGHRKRQAAVKHEEPIARPPPLPPDEVLRTVRPRPLHINDKVKVFWDLDAPGLNDVDNGNFAKWLVKTEEELQQGRDPCLVGSCQSQVVVVGHAFNTKVPKSVAKVPAAHEQPPRTTVHPSSTSTAPIVVPSFTQIRPALVGAHARTRNRAESSTAAEAPYIRYVAPDHEDLDSRVEQPHLWAGENSASLELDVESLYPSAKAKEDVTDAPPEVIEAVHGHWLAKRAAHHRPLLQRLWFEQPWVRAAAKGMSKQRHPGQEDDSESSDSDDESDGIPFMGKDDLPGNGKIPGGRVRHLAASDVNSVLYSMRADLEAARTLADQVRRREKLHKQDMAAWKDQMQEHLTLPADEEDLPEAPELVHDPKAQPNMSQMVSRAAKNAAALANTVVDLVPPQAVDEDLEEDAAAADDEAPACKRRKLQEPTTAESQSMETADEAIQDESADESAEDESGGEEEEDDEETSSQKVVEEDSEEEFLSARDISAAEDSPSDASTQDEVLLPRKRQKRDSGRPDNPTGPRPGSPKYPPGFTCVDGHLSGSLAFVAQCWHGSTQLDRLAKLAAFLNQHAQCRPEWRPLARRPSEDAAAHQERLRPLFPFQTSSQPSLETQAAARRPSTHQPRASGAQGNLSGRRSGVPQGPSARAQARHKNYVPGSLKDEPDADGDMPDRGTSSPAQPSPDSAAGARGLQEGAATAAGQSDAESGDEADDESDVVPEANLHATRSRGTAFGQAKGVLRLPRVPLEWLGKAEASRVLQPLWHVPTRNVQPKA